MTDHVGRLRELLAKATPGPWAAPGHGYLYEEKTAGVLAQAFGQHVREHDTLRFPSEDNAALIAAAVNALPALLDIAEAAKKLHHALVSPENCGGDPETCATCKHVRRDALQSYSTALSKLDANAEKADG